MIKTTLASYINRFVLLFFLATPILITGCNQTDKEHILRLSIEADPILLHPIAYNNRDAEQIVSLLYQKLCRTNALSGEPILDLAIRQPIIQDLGAGTLSITYSLDPQAIFQNQTPITSTDVAFSVLAHKQKQIAPFAWQDFESITKIETPDKHTVRFFVLGLPPGIAKTLCNDFFIISQNQYDPESKYLAGDWSVATENLQNGHFGSGQASQASGSGQYQLSEWKAGKHLILKLNSYKTLPKPEQIASQIRFFVLPDKFKAAKALRQQKIDIQATIDPGIFMAMQKNKEFTDHFHLLRQPCLQAVLLHINRQKIGKADACLLAKMLSNTAWPALMRASSVMAPALTPQIFDLSQEPIQPPKKPVSLIKNTPKQLGLRVLYRADNPAHAQLAGIICARISKQGFNIVPWPISPQEIKSTLAASDFELFLADLTLFPAHHDYRPLLGSQEKNSLNYSSYSTDKTDSLCAVMAWADNQATRTKTAKAIEAQILNNPPHILLGFKLIPIAISKRIEEPLRLQPYRPYLEISELRFK